MQQLLICVCVIFVIFPSSSEASLKCQGKSTRRCTSSNDGKLGRLIVDCSDIGLNSVPENLPLNVTHLYLDSNNIVNLENGSFGDTVFANLIFLSIRHNRMKEIDTKVFWKMDKLKNLDLYNNSLKYWNSLPEFVFSPLSQSLKVLDIRMNLLGTGVHYPPSVGELHNLEELKVDCLRGQSLPSEYSNLNKLRKIIFSSGYEHVGLLNENMFNAVRDLNVTEVDFSSLDIGVIGGETFSQLPKLQKLDLSDNSKLSRQFHNFAPSLKNTSMQFLMLNNTGIGGFGTSNKIKEFCDLKLKVLTLDSNQIESVDPLFKKCFPELEILSLADNHLLPHLTLWFNIIQLRNLVGVNVSLQYSFTGVHRKREILPIRQPRHTVSIETLCVNGMACPVFLPPKIQWIDVSRNGVRTLRPPELVFVSNSTLKYFKGSFCGYQTIQLPVYCVHSSISIVVPQLETIDMSNNNLQCINATFFDGNITHSDWNSLKYFYLSNNKLGLVEGNICNDIRQNTLGFLKPLKNLRVLDLAGNMLES